MITLDGIKVFRRIVSERLASARSSPVQFGRRWHRSGSGARPSNRGGPRRRRRRQRRRAQRRSVAAGQPSYTFTWSEGSSQKTKEMWIVDAPAPREYPRVVKQNAAARDSLRPSKLAATAKVRHVRDHLVADGIEGDWDEPEERMPDEDKEEDTGWRPGPIERDLPTFSDLAPTPGPTCPDLTSESPASQVVERFLPDRLCEALLKNAKAHCVWYRTKHGLNGRNVKKDYVERSVHPIRLGGVLSGRGN